MFRRNLQSPVWKLWLTRRLIFSTEQSSIYVSPFLNNLSSKKARNHEISKFFFNKFDRRLVSHTSITLNSKMLWFPNEERFWAVKLQTDITILLLELAEDKNFDGSLVLDFRNDDVTWKRSINGKYPIWNKTINQTTFNNHLPTFSHYIWGQFTQRARVTNHCDMQIPSRTCFQE